MKNIPWDIYHLFMQVARHGGLSGAAGVSGLSPATIGRRMLELETGIGRALFVRSRTGYRLTADGSLLLNQVLEMEGAARRVEEWQQDAAGSALVRISCGTWLAWWVARNFSALRGEEDRFRIEMIIAEQRAALAHRESDIGIRAFEPQEKNLASRRLGDVAYAVYRRRGAEPSASDRWLAVSEEAAISAYLRYPHDHWSAQIAVTVNRPRSLRDLVLAGAGLAVLPCFACDHDARLERVGEVASLRHSQWIVMNDDDRHRPEIRTAVDRLTKLVLDNARLFAGQHPLSPG